MEGYLIRANEDLLDQNGNLRLKRGEYYNLLGEMTDSFEIVDEMGRTVVLGKEHFCKIW